MQELICRPIYCGIMCEKWTRHPEVASAVMSHPFTRIVFRVGDDDAKKLAEGFSYFEAKDLRNLETGQAVCRVERSDFDFNLSVPLLRWAFGEAAVVAKRDPLVIGPLAQRLEARMGGNKFKANTVLAIKLARAVYFMLKNKTAFDPERLVAALSKN